MRADEFRFWSTRYRSGPSGEPIGCQRALCLRVLCSTLYASAFLLSVVSSLQAQTTSVVEGIVTDQQGLALGGAQVRIGNPELGKDRSALSSTDGTYRILGLSAGTYTITISKADFAVETLRNVELTVNRTVTLNTVLKLAALANS